MPNAVLSRHQYQGFRSGSWPSTSEPVSVEFQVPWDLYRIRPIFFPQSSCVVFGRRTSGAAVEIPPEHQVWEGRLPYPDAAWADAEGHLVRITKQVDGLGAQPTPHSPYGRRFYQGAVFSPRVLLAVEEQPTGPLGLPGGLRAVRSRRSPGEKKPWSQLEPLEGAIEDELLRPMLLGENLLHFRLTTPPLAVVPWDHQGKITSGDRLALYPGLEAWWTEAERLWNAYRSTDRLSLLSQMDYRRKLSAQLPAASVRLVYPKSGIHLAAAVVDDSNAVIDHTLYWAAFTDPGEARYLEAVLNSTVTDQRLKPLQSRGKDSARDIHLTVWQLPIPAWDPEDERHQQLGALAFQAEREAADVPLRPGDFRRQRLQIREALKTTGTIPAIDAVVTELFVGS